MAARRSSALSAIWGLDADPTLPSRTRRPFRAGVAAFAVFAGLSTFAAPHGPLQGKALAGGMAGTVGYEHARIGQSWWFTLPPVQNQWDSPVELVDAQVLDIPKGLEVSRYAAFSSEETNGVALLFEDGSPQFPAATYKDYSKHPIKLPPHEDNFIYYSLKTVITGPVSGEASRCRFTYTQGSDTFTQDLPCSFTLKLEE